MNLRIVFKFKDCKLQFYEKRRFFCYFSVNPCMPASHWRCLLKLKQKKRVKEKIISQIMIFCLIMHGVLDQVNQKFTTQLRYQIICLPDGTLTQPIDLAYISSS